MLTRKTFIEAISNIKKHEEIMDRLNDVVREMGDFPPNLDFESLNRMALLQVLKEAMNDKHDYISYLKLLCHRVFQQVFDSAPKHP